MSKQKFTLRGAVYLILLKGNQILLLRRANAGWKDGEYSLVAGHLDGNETVAEAMAREAKEEAGLEIKSEDLKVVHVVHHISSYEFVDFYLTADNWQGEPKIMEPQKCSDLSWFPLDDLPENTVENVRVALENYKNKIFFSEYRWE
ncbi:TPA: NUDIX hydrolase [candidate division CPR2 bacterium]|uniref:Nudix hydrolase domain-containing protein n=1 Tax=candidate division CPR2 bacterium GW2011_GWC1_41_48 TaxID=1618344 RepID=A0A0G0WA76_UNCC2|nr:MAG: hypothetical protein UT47_C0001G0295 [candidate division CPR2 bacterium GW2011_GWC2_39_35]KKR27622.1 MAG: hypothetical protein UT59_C0051G0003 [candidate division CPR2 bacterium GW2011_GWD1_39_7]KKR28847.1 MAG: hypothetical protein UT60_C0011G0013 [candidate division CPR2 bacterium GW2011_GWD2_39_7]KKS09890.1 MAG: hypothetical protein UU65_C0001G0295 [candidate division CPR2 bacterium GW2011_GWC1_41_48]OGB59455.1 MAG: hypothetical protein A2Y27_03835 [candidate division CPR2 bacterium G